MYHTTKSLYTTMYVATTTKQIQTQLLHHFSPLQPTGTNRVHQF